MDDLKYRLILYIIVFVILGTIGIQVYWNYKNYLSNKQQFVNEVQISLDNAVESYFADLAEKNTLRFAFREFKGDTLFVKDSIKHRIDFLSAFKGQPDSIKLEISDTKFHSDLMDSDSIFDLLKQNDTLVNWNSSKVIIKSFDSDSLAFNQLKTLTSKVIVSLTEDTLSLKVIDSLLEKELKRKNLEIPHYLTYNEGENKIQTFNKFSVFKKVNDTLVNKELLSTSSKSTYLPINSSLTIYFTNETITLLKRIISGIILSTLLVFLVISCLFYLLKIIKDQKQLAEIKNDLISNITHEFKTPISTIGVALESIKDFTGLNDTEKTKKYLNISGQQLSKLNTMVEKLLETATLDSSNLELYKETTSISNLLETLFDKYKLQYPDKKLTIELPDEEITSEIDTFHFENAINNLLDNAVKYGGENIIIKAEQNHFSFSILITDSGQGIPKTQKDKIFEKFYRIPQGNRHDVKGFGIGLYYTKTIIEKHHGAIHLDLGNNQTTFKITIPK